MTAPQQDSSSVATLKGKRVLVIDELDRRCDAAVTYGRTEEKAVLSIRLEALSGILHWIDALQDAAQAEGYPTVFLLDVEEDGF